MAKSASRSKKVLQKRTKLEWVLFLLLLAIILLLLASRYNWWPFNNGNNDNLGSAFYTSTLPTDESTAASTGAGASSKGSSGSSGSNGGSGSNGYNGGGGGNTTTPPAATTPKSALLNFSAGVDQGDTKEQISGQASGLNENCAILVNSSTAGKQEVCTYTEGDKVVTVTFLNDHVVSASRNGF